VNVSLAPDADDIEDLAGNDLFPAQWSFTVNIPVNPQPPVLDPIGNQTMPSSTSDLVLTLSATDPNNDPLTYTAVAQSIEYYLDQTLTLGFDGNYYLNYLGKQEKWMTSPGNTWHYITPDGKLYRWLGGNGSNDPLIETVSTANYANPALLHNAAANNAPATVSVSGNQLTINPHDSYMGKFAVTVTVHDGTGRSDFETFLVNVLSTGPDTTPPAIVSRTPADGATVATADIHIDVQFSEPVTGVDATDLVLTGAGAAGANVGSPTHIGNNTYRWSITGLVNGAVNVSLAADANDIEDAAGNDLAPQNWAFTVAIQEVQQPPVLDPIGTQTMPTTQDTKQVTLSASDPNAGDTLTFTAVAQSIEYELDQQLGLGFDGNYYLNWGGLQEKWMTGPGGAWFYIKPDGTLWRWHGGAATNATLIDTVSTAAYANPALLHNAQPNNAPAIVSIAGNILTLNPNGGFIGSFFVTVTVHDGHGNSDSEKIRVNVTA
jgi:hypothetical protein